VGIAAVLLLACFALRSSDDDSMEKNWVGSRIDGVSRDEISELPEAELAKAELASTELSFKPLLAPSEPEVKLETKEAEAPTVELAYSQTDDESFVDLASKQLESWNAPASNPSAVDDVAKQWDSAVVESAQPQLGNAFDPTPLPSVFVSPKSNRLYDLGQNVAIAESEQDTPEDSTFAAEQESPESVAEPFGLYAPKPFEPAPSESADSEPRVASLVQDSEKPKFKKFGAVAKKKTDSADEDDDDPPEKQPVVLSSSTKWKLAPTPRKGDRYKEDTPLTDDCSHFIEGAEGNFSPTPTMPGMAYDPLAQMNVYQGKTLNANQRPLLELGRPWYQLGPISEGSSILGFHNHVNPQYLLFGDARSGFASNNVGGDGNTLIASQLNFFHHLKLTSTERFVAGHTPLSRGANNTRYNFDDSEFEFEGNANFNFAYIEGDIGAITGGAIGKTLPFDLPFAAGIIPLVFQNGIWMEDEILGFAVTIPARNSPRLDISNMDITFFAGYDRLNSPAFLGDDSAARVMGIATFIDAMNGHFEIDYAFLDDRTNLDRSYHNIGIGFTRRYGRFLSNSTRVIVNAGQQSGVPGTADGVLLLSENSLITGFPSTVVPYLNMFAGFDRPQSVGRNVAAGGVLRNTGILFESDNLTGYPTLDATANDTFGMSLGLNLLADEFAQQLIVEASMLGVMGDGVGRNALGDQYGLGVRYQLPLTNSVLVRADAMVGFLRNDEDINGARLELRKKF
jgi:hypothetical protein